METSNLVLGNNGNIEEDTRRVKIEYTPQSGITKSLKTPKMRKVSNNKGKPLSKSHVEKSVIGKRKAQLSKNKVKKREELVSALENVIDNYDNMQDSSMKLLTKKIKKLGKNTPLTLDLSINTPASNQMPDDKDKEDELSNNEQLDKDSVFTRNEPSIIEDIHDSNNNQTEYNIATVPEIVEDNSNVIMYYNTPSMYNYYQINSTNQGTIIFE